VGHRLLADHNLRRPVVRLLRDHGHDVVTLRELGLDRADDDEVLLRAATDERTLLTGNIGDFVLLHRAWLRWSRLWGVSAGHAGIVIVPQDQGWDDTRIVGEIELVIGSPDAREPAHPLRNALWRWRPSGGWHRVADRM
jgi:hypothetical protein